MPTAPTAPTKPPPEAPWREFARAPLVPVALAATLGLILDRYAGPPAAAWTAAAGGGFLAWLVAFRRRSPAAGLWLAVAAAGLAGWHHHAYRTSFAADDIGAFAPEQPVLVRVRGTLDEEPVATPPAKPDPLLAVQKGESSTTMLALTEIHTADGWRSASGRARIDAGGRLIGLHLGDAVEVLGKLSKPSTAANPGEVDSRSRLLDQRVTAVLRAEKAEVAVVRLEEGWRGSVLGWFAVVRGWGTRAVSDAIPAPEAGVAAALLLGDGSAMDRGEWDGYVRTGVVHVLAISGQHLVVLAGFVWLVLRVAGVRRRRGAWAVALLIVGYAILTGGRPSATRAAVMVCVVCGGVVLRRPVVPANAFALAWLVVVALNPADPFTAGCQLSFLSVFCLVWGVGRWLAPGEVDPVEQLIDESRPPAVRFTRTLLRIVAAAFAVSLALGVANAPLLLVWQNIVSPVGVLLGPPLVLLTSVALVAGFLLLVVSPLGPWAGVPLAWVTTACLAACGWLVRRADELPGGAVYAPAPSVVWAVGYYALLVGGILLVGTARRRAFAGLAAWTVGGLLLTARPASDEARVTFLSVGHGGCVVIEAPDGRVLLYDTGTLNGPDVVRRTIAPFLWSRGISRVDEVFLSHADLDHFNGLPELLRRFPVGRVTHTPSFAGKSSPGVAEALAALERHGVRTRVAAAGDRFTAGRVTLDVLHPPTVGPPGKENVRSLVMLVGHAGHAVLLTGDLEGAGQAAVLKMKPPGVDVLLAPHHGSRLANGPDLARWARPRLVVSSQERKKADDLTPNYAPAGAAVWDTAAAGAVTLRSHPTGLTAEAFRTAERLVVRSGDRR